MRPDHGLVVRDRARATRARARWPGRRGRSAARAPSLPPSVLRASPLLRAKHRGTWARLRRAVAPASAPAASSAAHRSRGPRDRVDDVDDGAAARSPGGCRRGRRTRGRGVSRVSTSAGRASAHSAPPARSSIRSQRRAASARSCSATTTARPPSTVARSKSIAASWCATSSPAIGSSSSSSGASWARARARCTRWRSPPDSSAMRTLGERGRVGRRQGARDRVDVGRGLGLQPPEVRQPAQRHRLAHRQRHVRRRVLRQQRRVARDLPARQRRHRRPRQRHAARRRRVQSEQQPQQRRLAGAVGTAQRDQLARRRSRS